MATIQGDRDVFLQDGHARTAIQPLSSIILKCSTNVFHGAIDPASIAITADLTNITGTVTFTPTGCTLTGTSGNTTNVAYVNVPGASASVVATLTVNGVTLTSNTLYFAKVTDGTSGTSGTSVFVGTVYKQQASAPSAPTGGTFNFTSSTLTPPSGWTVAQPTSTTTPTYACEYTFSTATPGATVTAGTWTTPVIDAVNGSAGANGNDGLSVLTLEVYYQVASAPSAPTPGSGSYTFSTDTFSNTGMTLWSRTLPASSTTPTYRSAYTFSTSTPSVAVAGGTWSTPVIVAQNGSTGGTGSRGAGHFYATGSSWSDATADAATPGSNVVDDVVTISNGSTFVLEKKWTGSAWVASGVVIDGNLLVTGSVQTASVAALAIDTSKLAASSVTATKISVSQLDAISATIGILRTATSGARTEVADNVIRVYDSSNVLRVKIGNLA